MPAAALAIINLITLAVKAAPEVEKVYEDGKTAIGGLFEGEVITADQQSQLMTWADSHQAATLAGTTPPEFVVS